MNLSITIDQSSICLIVDKIEDRPIGTGFTFIKNNWIVTAKHVVLISGIPRSSLSIVPNKQIEILASIMFTHPFYDLAVLQINNSASKIPLFPSYQGHIGTRGLFCCGYTPSLSNKEQRQYSIYVNQIPEYNLEHRSRDIGDEELLTFEAPFLEGGHSGGPILGEGGGVVAVITERFAMEEKYFGRATSIIPLLDFLQFYK